MPSSHHNRLLHQLTYRVLVVLVAVVVIISTLVFGFQHTALDKSVRTFMDSIRLYYEGRITLLDQDWQERVIRLHARIESKNLFASSEKSLENLQGVLRLEDRDTFPVILVMDADQKIIFQLSDTIEVSEHFTAKTATGWYFDGKKQALFRWYRQPIWMGARGKGKLVLFVPMDNALLFRNAMPVTDLFLIHEEQVVASSLGHVNTPVQTLKKKYDWQNGFRYDQSVIPWGGHENLNPTLVIRYQSTPLFSVLEIMVVGSLVFALIALLFWQSLGSWVVLLTQRVAILNKISKEFSRTYIMPPAMRDQLNQANSIRDEISDLSDAMVNLIGTAIRHSEELEHQARELKESDDSSRALTQSLRDTVLVFDARGKIHYCNKVGATLFGLTQDELIKRPIASLFSCKKNNSSRKKEHFNFLNYKEDAPRSGTLDGTAKHADGREFPVEVSLSHWTRRNTHYFTAVVRDVTEHKLLEARDLRAYVNRVAISALLEIGIEALTLHRKLEVALEIILTVPWLAVQYKGSIFLTTDNNELDMVVQKGLHDHLMHTCRRIPFGFCMCGKAAQSKQIEFSSALDARHDVAFEEMQEHGHYCVPILLRGKLLGILNLYVNHGHRHDPEEDAFLVTIANTLAGLIERGQVEDRVQHMASHDMLTGLPNRMLFRGLLEQEIRHASRYQKKLAAGFLDLDHFKAVNDTLGHEAGDQLLKAVSTRIKEHLRDSDTLARLGGDEFTLILPSIGETRDVLLVAKKMIDSLSKPFIIMGQPCQIGASIGISLFPEHGQTVDALLQKADRAMYVVKKSGRNHVAIYSSDMES
ncbi:MAG: diguanylate cyclase [Magnetococcales bacterium]|nr:diguanylate cyclase [Magnetococcales bacterium]